MLERSCHKSFIFSSTGAVDSLIGSPGNYTCSAMIMGLNPNVHELTISGMDALGSEGLWWTVLLVSAFVVMAVSNVTHLHQVLRSARISDNEYLSGMPEKMKTCKNRGSSGRHVLGSTYVLTPLVPRHHASVAPFSLTARVCTKGAAVMNSCHAMSTLNGTV